MVHCSMAVYFQKQCQPTFMTSFGPSHALCMGKRVCAVCRNPLSKEIVMTSIRRFFRGLAAMAGVAVALLAGAGTAQARDVYWSVGVNSPGVSVGVGNYGQPVYVAPAPVYVPPPVYYAPPPRPVYYAPPAPVYYAPPAYYGHRPHRHHRNYYRHYRGRDDD